MVWMRRGVLALWEAPQNVLGVLVLGIRWARGRVVAVRGEAERWLIQITEGGAVSLGWFVFWTNTDNPYVPVGAENKAHELGHGLQSRMLGPLYLPVVGLTSELRVIYAVLHRLLTGRRWGGYYDGFPENWADRLGGAERSLRPPP